MKIETSMDWNKVSSELSRQLSTLPFNPDLRKLHLNIKSLNVYLVLSKNTLFYKEIEFLING